MTKHLQLNGYKIMERIEYLSQLMVIRELNDPQKIANLTMLNNEYKSLHTKILELLKDSKQRDLALDSLEQSLVWMQRSLMVD